MHEAGIANEIVAAAVAETRARGARKITAVAIRVGVLRGIVPGSLRMYFELASGGTPAEGAVLEIEEEPVLVACPGCGEIPAAGLTLTCPSCGRDGVTVKGGDSLLLLSIEIE